MPRPHTPNEEAAIKILQYVATMELADAEGDDVDDGPTALRTITAMIAEPQAALLSALEAQETALEKQAAFEAVSLDQPGSRAIFDEYVEAARIAVELRRTALALARTA